VITIDNDVIKFTDDSGQIREVGIGTPEGFRLLSKLWLRSGWDTKYVYSFTWLGRPMIQLPEDMLRIQEVIYRVKPDVLIETGIAHGGSLIFYASLFETMNHGRVIGIDIEIRQHNRVAIEAHELFDRITIIEGSSVDPDIVSQICSLIEPGERGLVVLDSNHSNAHVLAELHAYAEFVAIDSYMVACDGIMKEVTGAPRTHPEWITDNPLTAISNFLKTRDDFSVEEQAFLFNEGQITERVTYWPHAYLKRIR
jgi:cephalosporin hydroxylase